MIKIKGLEHVSWAAPDLDPGAQTLRALGFEVTGAEEIHTQDVVSTYFEHPTGVRFEIIRPCSCESHLRRFLGKRGPGLHHVCMQVESLGQALGEVERLGWKTVGESFEDSRGTHAFIHPESTGGVLIGLIELHPGLS